MTNISVIVAATAIANESSSGRRPETTSLSTLIGSATRRAGGSAKSRFSRARSANSITSSSAGAAGLPGGSSRGDLVEDRPGLGEAEDVEVADQRQAELAAVDQQVEVARRGLRDLLREHQVGLGDQRLDPVVDELRLDRVLLVDEHLDRRLLRGQAGERARACRSGPRAGSARRGRRRTRPSASASSRLETSTHSTRLQSSPRARPRSMPPSSPPRWKSSSRRRDLVEEGDPRLRRRRRRGRSRSARRSRSGRRPAARRSAASAAGSAGP